jgi:ribonuclease HI
MSDYKFDIGEAHARLQTIVEMVERAVRTEHMLVATERLLKNISSVAQGADEVMVNEIKVPALDHIIISCDASIKENPGGPSAVGVVIQWANRGIDNQDPTTLAQPSPATTNNQAEYDAIYFALTTLAALHNNPGCPIEIRSDSQLVIKQLNKEIECNDPALLRRRDLILELVKELPVPVMCQWRPRNSTPELKLANHLAQDLLGVRRH